MDSRFARRSIALAALVALFGVLPGPVSVSGRQAERGPVGAGLATSAQIGSPELEIGAGAAILIDLEDGRVLWEKNSKERRSIASTTKIVTALVVLRRSRLGETVRASPSAEAIGQSDSAVAELELRAGEELTVEQLMYGLLLESASDAAVALAEHVGGSVESFVAMMNELTTSLGAKDTRFVNPHGLDEEGHFSSAADLALLSRAAMRLPEFRKIVETATYEIPRSPRPVTVIQNRNLLLGSYRGANGVKTGHTRLAGRALVASASRDGESRLTVVLGATDAFADAREILDFGFEAFARYPFARVGQPWGYVTYGNGVTKAILPTRDGSVLVRKSEAQPTVSFSVATGRVVATVQSDERVSIQARLSCISNPCASEEIDRYNPVNWLWRIFGPIARVIFR